MMGMNKQEFKKLAQDYIEKYIPGHNYIFKYNKGYRRVGYCNIKDKIISVSEVLLEQAGFDEAMDTLLHEIAHAIAYEKYNSYGHTQAWRNICCEIGAKPERVKEGLILKKKIRHVYQCPSCKTKFHFDNKFRVDRACGLCSKVYDPSRKLVYLGTEKVDS